MHRAWAHLGLLGLLATSWGCQSAAVDRAYRVRYDSGPSSLTIEILDDDLVHFEFADSDSNPGPASRIPTTPMVFKADYPGPSEVIDDGQGTLKTPEIALQVDPESLIVTITTLRKDPPVKLTTLTPLSAGKRGLQIEQHRMQHVYGLGQEFKHIWESNGDWVSRVRAPGCEFGNALVDFEEGASSVGNIQIPVMYVVGPENENYALFMDDLRALSWDLIGTRWKIETTGDAVRGYFMAGPDLPDLRSDYMELVGRPPVPPKKMFGLWVSEYGYEDWAELEDKLRTLRGNHFPVDGFFLDLQWFGGIASGTESTRMGSLTWDSAKYPHPARKIAELRDKHGIGIIPIEEPFVGRGLIEHETLSKKGYLAHKADSGNAVRLTSWWGIGGLIDWTNPKAADYWQDEKRRPLLEAGVMGHWTDLGEPETFDAAGRYHGISEHFGRSHADIHNAYNFKWAESIARGYERDDKNRRPFILSRSGTAGIQRFGAALWSGDIASRMSHLATHLQAQMQMSFSGIDYFGSDVGGFKRSALDGDLDDLYTRWLATSCLFDVPVRPHASNTDNKHETAPDRVGDMQSNLANIRLRYELIPYLYSLAHRAYLYGEPVFPPLAFYHQNDFATRPIGDVKMIGRDLIGAAIKEYGSRTRNIFAPAGWWINYYTDEWHNSNGRWLRGVSMEVDGALRPALSARTGAIIPLMFVAAKSMNALGRSTDGSRRDELIVRVYGDQTPSEFTLYEDDGETTDYLRGEVRTTRLAQVAEPGEVRITIGAAKGTYAGAPSERDNVIRLVTNHIGKPIAATLNGEPLPRLEDERAFEAAAKGWYVASLTTIMAKTGRMDVGTEKTLRFSFVAD